MTQNNLAHLFGLPIRLGTTAHLEQAAMQVLAEPVAKARSHMQTPHSHVWMRQVGTQDEPVPGCERLLPLRSGTVAGHWPAV